MEFSSEENWAAVWAAQPNNGTDFTVMNDSDITTVRLGTNRVTLNDVPLLADETRTANVIVTLAENAPLTTVQLQPTLGDRVVLNGVSCQDKGPVPPG